MEFLTGPLNYQLQNLAELINMKFWIFIWKVMGFAVQTNQ